MIKLQPPNRGQFHKKNERAGARPEVPGAGLVVHCSFCQKTFGSVQSANQHEHSRHKKLLKRLMRDNQDNQVLAKLLPNP